MKKLLWSLLTILALALPLHGKGGSSFSGGSSRPSVSVSVKPSTPSFKPSGSSFSSGSSSSSKPSSSFSFSGGSSSSTVKTTTPVPNKTPLSVSKRPAAPSFDSLAISDAKKVESRANYQKANKPAESYKTPKGETKKIEPSDKQAAKVRDSLDQNKWSKRTEREEAFYSRYRPTVPLVVHYSDPYNSMFNYWLLSQSLDTMSLYILHHQAQMDQQRLKDLYARNSDLEARVKALQEKGVQPDESWEPEGVDPDLLYSDEYVDATYNPTAGEVEEYEYGDNRPRWWVVLIVFIVLIVLFVAFAVWCESH